MTASLHDRLRAATAPAHHALESDLAWERRIATRGGYLGLLARLRGFHAAYEPAIGRTLADDAFFDPRRRLARLDADLADLGLGREAIAALPVPRPVPIAGRARALGALYVLEGSTLGGQVIGRQVASRLGFDGTSGCTYFAGRGRATGAMWQAFRAALETLAGDEAAEATALAAGIATFEALRTWLAGLGDPAA